MNSYKFDLVGQFEADKKRTRIYLIREERKILIIYSKTMLRLLHKFFKLNIIEKKEFPLGYLRSCIYA